MGFASDWNKKQTCAKLSTGWTSLQRLDWEAARLPINTGEGKLHHSKGIQDLWQPVF